MEDGKGKMEGGQWKMEDGKGKMEGRKWKMEDGRWKTERGKSPFSILHFPSRLDISGLLCYTTDEGREGVARGQQSPSVESEEHGTCSSGNWD